MDECLQLLITHYEAEQQNLQTLLDECLSEEDYRFARYYLKNLRLLRETLFNLYSLSDYAHAEKARLLRILSNLRSAIKYADHPLLKALREKEINELTAKLSLLNEKPIIEVEEKHNIENAIIQLVEEKINGFKFFISKRDNLYLDFTLAEADVIHIGFTPFNLLHGEYSFNNFFEDSKIEILKRNGFKLSDNANILYIDFDLKDRSTQTLVIFLSKLFLKPSYGYAKENFELSIY